MKNRILAVGLVVLFASCNQTKQSDYLVADTQLIAKDYQTGNEGYALMKTHCYVCHIPEAGTHNEILAPPFKAVKMHYKSAYNDRADFIKAVVTWVQDPNEEYALMRGPVKKFEVMPPVPLPAKDWKKLQRTYMIMT